MIEIDIRFRVLCGPQVKIRISNGSYEIPVSRRILCKLSPYFTAMFEGKFHESETQTTTMEAVDGVVSEQGFERLVLWLYTGRLLSDTAVPGDRISAIIELARLCDMCGITAIHDKLVTELVLTIVNNRNDEQPHTKHITSEHVRSAAKIPPSHPTFVKMAQVLAAGIVEGGARSKFAKETQLYPKFGVVVLHQVRSILNTIKPTYRVGQSSTYTDPIFNIVKNIKSAKL